MFAKPMHTLTFLGATLIFAVSASAQVTATDRTPYPTLLLLLPRHLTCQILTRSLSPHGALFIPAIPDETTCRDDDHRNDDDSDR
jgi:hypothetical protein